MFPPRLETLGFAISLRSGEAATLDFWSSNLLQNARIKELDFYVAYWNRRDVGARDMEAVLRLDKTMAARVDSLVWESECVMDKIGDTVRVLGYPKQRTWVFERAFPEVSKKFFAGMPQPFPGRFDKGPNATRLHTNSD